MQIPDNITAGVIVTQPTMQKWTDSTKELQAAGVLVNAGNAATNATAAGPLNIVSWNTAPITLTQSRKIQIVVTGLVNGTAIGNIAQINLTLGGLTHVIQRYISAVAGAGQIDINSTSVYATLTAGSYALAATLTRLGVAGTVTMAGSCYLNILDMGPA